MRVYWPRSAPPRAALLLSLALLAGIAAWAGWRAWQFQAPAPDAGGEALVGGSFALTDQYGALRRDTDFRGRFMLVYFGFTHCPDICPATLQAISAALDRLGGDAASVVPVFITVDPARDTPAALAAYAAAFHPRLVALTGDAAAIDAVARAYRVYYQAAAAAGGGDYGVDHSSIVYLIGPDGRYRTHADAGASPDQLADLIRGQL
jgi:protein SCO1/2